VTSLPRWRIAAAVLVLAGLALLAAKIGPLYIHNLALQKFAHDLAANPESRVKPDDLLRTQVLDQARALELPVKPDNVQIARTPEALRIDVRYIVRVDLPGYSVDLHFYPGASSR
jgi:hypothetical protein